MLINGNEVNNLFLNGTRFRCLDNCFIVAKDTYYCHLTYINNGDYFKVDDDVDKNGIYIGSTTQVTYVFSSLKVYKGTPSDICKIYGSKIVDSHNYLNSNSIYYSFPAFNSAKGQIYLFDEDTYEYLQLGKYL